MDLLEQYKPNFFFDFYEQSYPIDYNTYLHEGDIVKAVINGHVQYKNNKIYLHYWSFYLQDNGMKCCFKTWDAHKYDLEGVIIELTHYTISGICFTHHGSSEFYWIRHKEDLKELMKTGTLQVYVSRGKHSSYPIEGMIYRYFGFANDICRHPIQLLYTLVPYDYIALQTTSFDQFVGPAIKLNANYDNIPEIRLSQARTHMLFRFRINTCL